MKSVAETPNSGSIRLQIQSMWLSRCLVVCSSALGFTWASQVGVSVVPGVLVILEHIQSSGLRKHNLYEYKHNHT